MRKFTLLMVFLATTMLSMAQLYWNTNGTGAAINAANWASTSAGPFTSAWVDGSDMNFTANSAITYVTGIPIGNINISDGITVTLTAAGTLSTGGTVKTVTIGTGSTLTWNGQSVSTTAGTGFIKSGNGTWNIGAQGNAYPGGFTLNAGMVVLGGVNALGSGGTLTINGGTIAANAARDLSGKYAGGIVVGGDFQLGSGISPAVGTSNLTFTNNMDLGGTTRIITIGGPATYSLGGIISNGGLTLNNSVSGTVLLTGANTYTGATTLNGGILKLNPSANLTNATAYILNGGVLSTAGITATRTITASTLQLLNNTTIDFGTNAHTLTFAASDAVSWTAGKKLIVSGWVGTAGNSGTAAKLFVGNSDTGLTPTQLSQIRFLGFAGSAMQLATGEIVPSATAAATMSGTFKVGSSEVSPNFSTLADAIYTLNASNITGDVVLEVTSNLTVPENLGLGVNTNGFSITIRPDADADRTITFTQLADNPSPTGHLVIGYQGVGAAWSDVNTIPTSNVTIDGYAVGGSTRRLKLTNTTDNHVGARIISIVGGCQNVTIRNCIIENKTTNGTSPACVAVVPRKGTTVDAAPANTIIDNNILTGTGSVSMGVRLIVSGTPTAYVTGFIMRNNTVTVQRRLVELSYMNGANIYNNEFNLVQTAVPGSLIYGIFANTAFGTNPVNIYNNKFKQATVTENSASGAYGIRVISLGSGPSAWNIYNNTFAGMNRIQTSGAATLNLSYIQVAFGTANIYHNTFYMPAVTAAAAAGYYNAINNSNAQTAQKIRNNIFISDEPTAACAFVSNVCVSPGESENNIYYHRQTNANAKVVAAYADLASYQIANPTLDINSKSINVNFTNAAISDFSVTAPSLGDVNLRVPRLATVLKDITGADRKTNTYAGAYDAGDLNPKKPFTVTVPNGTDKVYIAGSFTDKLWDITNPLELTATANPNEFSANLDCEDGVEYKYFCEKGNWDYQEATSVNPLTWANNHTWAASDNVLYWYAMPKVTLNVSIGSGGIPANLFVKGSWNGWATAIELTKSGDTYSGFIGGNAGDKIYSNTQYKYYTNDMVADNLEVFTDNRWSIYPTMTDVIASFTTPIPATGISEATEMSVRIMRTYEGITAVFDGNAVVELYSINGALIDKTNATGSYSRELNHGAYIIRINGKATKFVK